MQPLRGDLDPHPAVRRGFRQSRFRAEEGLVLHADLVGALDDDVVVRREQGVETVAHLDAPQHVALRVQRRRVGPDRVLWVGDRHERLVVDLDGRDPPASKGRGLGGDDRDGLAMEAHPVRREHGLVGNLEPVGRPSRDVLVCQRTADPRDPQRRGHVDGANPRRGVRAPEGRAEQRAVPVQVRREFELPGHLGDPLTVRSCGTNLVVDLSRLGRRHAPDSPRSPATSSTASTMAW